MVPITTDSTPPGPAPTPADAWRLRVTHAAKEQFMAAHPNEIDEGSIERQLRELAADLIAEGKVQRKRHLKFYRPDIYVVVSSDLQAIVAYHTEHRFRTWAQIKAGVPSPVGEAAATRKNKKGALRRIAKLEAAAVEAGGQVARIEDGEAIEITGPGGTMSVHQWQVRQARAERSAFYADLASTVGLSDLAELCPPPDADVADVGWFAIE